MSLTLELNEARSKQLMTEKLCNETGETKSSVEANENKETVDKIDLSEQKQKIDCLPFFGRTKKQMLSSSMGRRRIEDDRRDDDSHAKLIRFLKPVFISSGVVDSSSNNADQFGVDDNEFHAKLIRQLKPRESGAGDPSSIHLSNKGTVQHRSCHPSHGMLSQTGKDFENEKPKEVDLTNCIQRSGVRTPKIDDIPGEICFESLSNQYGSDRTSPLLSSSNSIRALLQVRPISHCGQPGLKTCDSVRTIDTKGRNEHMGGDRAPNQKRSRIYTLGYLRRPNATVDANGREAKKKIQIQAALSKCASSTFSHLFQPTKKKHLCLKRMEMTSEDIPISALNGTVLGNSMLSLSLSWNKIDSLPCKLVQCLPNLRTLDLSHCTLHSLPLCWKLPKLEQLDLSHNALQEFPFERIAEGLPSLQNLNLNSNRLSLLILPKFSTLVVSLTILNVGNNDITQLPEALVDYKNLKSLNLENNSLFGIPPFFCKMVSLKTCYLSGNPICSPPIHVSERGLKAIQCYWQKHPVGRNSMSTECSNIST